MKCPQSESPCGENLCYNPMTENCTKTKVVQCIHECGYFCYDPASQQCLNGKICRRDEQLCMVKYYISTMPYPFLYYKCYNPLYEVCLNHSVRPHPSRLCNNQCLNTSEVCVDNTTICTTNGYYPYYPKQNEPKSCDGQCYDSTMQQCIGNAIRWLDGSCPGKCFNSSSQQRLNGTICQINEQLCPTSYPINAQECYNPSTQACLDARLCDYPIRRCNGKCLLNTQICIDHVTVWNVEDTYTDFQADQIKSCNGVHYNSTIRQCADAYQVYCIRDPSRQKCRSSSVKHEPPFALFISMMVVICAFLNFS